MGFTGIHMMLRAAGGRERLYGLTFGIYTLSGIFMTPLYGLWSDRRRTFLLPCVLGTFVNAIGAQPSAAQSSLDQLNQKQATAIRLAVPHHTLVCAECSLHSTGRLLSHAPLICVPMCAHALLLSKRTLVLSTEHATSPASTRPALSRAACPQATWCTRSRCWLTGGG